MPEVALTKSRRTRRVPRSPDLVAELRTRVGRLAPNAIGSPGSFAAAVRRRSGIEGFHMHQMRHTFACRWPERGGSLGTRQQMLGRPSIESKQRHARLGDEAMMRETGRLQRDRS